MTVEITRFARNLDASGLFGGEGIDPQFSIEHVTVVDGQEHPTLLTVRLVEDRPCKTGNTHTPDTCVTTCDDKDVYLKLYAAALELIGEPQPLT